MSITYVSPFPFTSLKVDDYTVTLAERSNGNIVLSAFNGGEHWEEVYTDISHALTRLALLTTGALFAHDVAEHIESSKRWLAENTAN